MGALSEKNYTLILSIVGLFYAFTAFLDYFFAFLSMIFLEAEFAGVVYRGTSFWKIVIFLCTRMIVFIGFLGVKRRDSRFKIYIAEYKRSFFCVFIVVCWILARYQMIMVEMTLGERPMNGMEGSVSILLAMIVMILAEAFL